MIKINITEKKISHGKDINCDKSKTHVPFTNFLFSDSQILFYEIKYTFIVRNFTFFYHQNLFL